MSVFSHGVRVANASSPTAGSLPDRRRLLRILQAGIWAPSPDNNQPWQLRVGPDSIQVRYDRQAELNADKLHVLNFLSLGMLIENMAISATHERYHLNVSYPPDNSHRSFVAEITFTPEDTEPSTLAPLIRIRRTNRSAYRPVALSEKFFHEIDETHPGRTSLFLCTRPAEIAEMAQALSHLDLIRLTFKELHGEIFARLRWSQRELQHKCDGICVHALGLLPGGTLGLRLARHWPLFNALNHAGLGKVIRQSLKRQLCRSSAIGFLTTEGLGRQAIVETGRHFQRLWLIAEKHRISIQPLGSYPVFSTQLEDPAFCHSSEGMTFLRQCIRRVQEIFPAIQNRTTVIAWRMGYPRHPAPASVRKPLEALVKWKLD